MDAARATNPSGTAWRTTWKPRGVEGPHVHFVDRRLAAWVQRTIEPVAVRLELWDGSSPYAAPSPPIGDVIVRDRRALLGLIVNPDFWFGEAYMAGRLDVRGPLEPVVEALSRLSAPAPSWLARAAAQLASPNGVTGARQNVHHHYDLGNAFYEQWLDSELVYTCAYFADPEMPLDQAQRAKIDLVCRKLRLRPGERVVEAGCGWGALALHMARRYGVHVKAFNLSRKQITYARMRAVREGLHDRVEFIEDDYRNAAGRFDVFVSVGMLEHVGLPDFATFGDVIDRSLAADGRGLLHFIGRNQPLPLNRWIRKRIFPGAYPPSLREVFGRILEPHGFSVLDVENLRLHYAKTLHQWLGRFETAASDITERFDDTFVRAWRLYLAGSLAAFSTGWMQLFQVVFARGSSNAIPWTRVSA